MLLLAVELSVSLSGCNDWEMVHCACMHVISPCHPVLCWVSLLKERHELEDHTLYCTATRTSDCCAAE